jgi:N-acetylglutamate synthase-like GNAT family acetyltransferase
MSEASIEMIDNSIWPATVKDVPQLADLYAKQFLATGFCRFAASQNREELFSWVEQLCRENKLWIIRDSLGPVTLGHYEPGSSEIITIVTRDGMEGQGYGARMLCALATADPLVKVHPVTRSGKALAKKCGFSPKEEDETKWIRSVPANG